jgi:nitrite reductase (NADH) small subunit
MTTTTWVDICAVDEIPRLGARRVRRADGIEIAIFRTSTDTVFALRDECPHKKGPLSQGIVHGDKVTCPLHGWVISLVNGGAQAPDIGCTERYATRIDSARVFLDLTPIVESTATAHA